MGPRYSSSFPRTLPFCITSIRSSRTRLRAAYLVGPMRLLHSMDEGISPRFANPRGISLGQQVFPTVLFCSRLSISSLSFSSGTVAKYLDFLFVVAVWFDAGSSVFRFLDPLPLPLAVLVGFVVAEFVTDADSTKKSFRILLLLPSFSNIIPSSSSMRFFF